MTGAGAGFEALRYEVADGIATITLDRPDALNAFDRQLKRELLEAIRAAARDPAVRVLILTGAGRAFSAGQDLRERQAPDAPPLATVVRDEYNPLILAMRRLEKPIIGAINGVAAGAGASIALACDLRIAAEGASFILAFGRIGLVPDSGASWFLPRLVGPAIAAELAFTGDPLTAEEAFRRGAVNRVVAADSLMDEARALATRLAAGAPRALALTKRALQRSQESGLEEALANEASLQGIAGGTSDHSEGLAAFVEKRPPRFKGT
jgi:2-(1,2-epoxy-1,2-dihydrophenyl)acetyl-CoA isomerase